MMTDFSTTIRAHQVADKGMSLIAQKSAAAGKPVTCAKGCFACCMEPVLATREEAEYIVDSLTPEQRVEVTEKTRVWAVKMKNSGMLDEMWPHVYFYRMFKLWCPLLKDGLCSVYERRPTACRMHLVTGPRQHCEDDNKRLGQEFAYSPEVGEACAAAHGPGESRNLGVWLAEMLCGIKLETVSRFIAEAEGDDLVIGPAR